MMSDLVKQEECARFIEEFGEDAERLFGIHLPNSRDVTAQNNELRMHEGWMEVYLYAEIDSGDRTWTVMIPTVLFNPDWSEEDLLNNVGENFGLDQDEAQRRLQRAGLLPPGAYAKGECTCNPHGSAGCPKHDAVDHATKRIGSPHAEDVVEGRARCGVCGWIDEADPADPLVREWHGDSFIGHECPHGQFWYAEVYSENPEHPVGAISIDCDKCTSSKVECKVECKFCHEQVPAATAHRHGGGHVGDACCWDERLRASE